MNLKDLSSNSTLVAALSYIKCPNCGFLDGKMSLKLADPCPNCGSSGTSKGGFPSISAVTVFRMIQHFYSEGITRTDDQLQKVQEFSTSGVDKEKIRGIYKKISRLYNQEGGGDESFRKMLEIIQERLIVDERKARNIFPMILAPPKVYEYDVVVILTCTFLEALFDELLTELLRNEGSSARAISAVLDEVRYLGTRFGLFKKLTETKFSSALEETEFKDFPKDWEVLRDRRNKFLHGNPFAIGKEHADKAWELAVNSFSVFASMYNKFCAKTKSS